MYFSEGYVVEISFFNHIFVPFFPIFPHFSPYEYFPLYRRQQSKPGFKTRTQIGRVVINLLPVVMYTCSVVLTANC